MRIQVVGDIIKLYGAIWEGDGVYISSVLEGLEGHGDLTIQLHTPGGSVFDGNLIFNTIQSLKRKVHFQIVGLAASMGSILIASGSSVSIASNAYIMIHSPKGSLNGTAKDFEKAAVLLKAMEQNFIDVYAKRTKKDKKLILAWLDGDNWFSATKALAEGLVDKISNPMLKDEDINAVKEMSIAAMLTNPISEHKSFQLEDEIIPGSNQTQNNMKLELIIALGLANVNASSSDTAIIEAVKKTIEEKDKIIRDKDVEITALKKEKSDIEEATIKATLDEAEKVGKFTKEQRVTYEKIAKNSGLEAVNTILATVQPRMTISSKVIKPGEKAETIIPEDRKTWDWNKWQKEDPSGLETLAKTEGEGLETFNALYQKKFNKEFKQ